MLTEHSPTMLVVEDNDLDVERVARMLARLKANNPVVHAHDGLEALDLLRGNSGKNPLRRPYVILLDLNMPRMNGYEFLQELRGDAELSGAPVYVVSTSNRQYDIDASQQHAIRGYIVKPITAEQVREILASVSDGDGAPETAPKDLH